MLRCTQSPGCGDTSPNQLPPCPAPEHNKPAECIPASSLPVALETHPAQLCGGLQRPVCTQPPHAPPRAATRAGPLPWDRYGGGFAFAQHPGQQELLQQAGIQRVQVIMVQVWGDCRAVRSGAAMLVEVVVLGGKERPFGAGPSCSPAPGDGGSNTLALCFYPQHLQGEEGWSVIWSERNLKGQEVGGREKDVRTKHTVVFRSAGPAVVAQRGSEVTPEPFPSAAGWEGTAPRAVLVPASLPPQPAAIGSSIPKLEVPWLCSKPGTDSMGCSSSSCVASSWRRGLEPSGAAPGLLQPGTPTSSTHPLAPAGWQA